MQENCILYILTKLNHLKIAYLLLPYMMVFSSNTILHHVLGETRKIFSSHAEKEKHSDM